MQNLKDSCGLALETLEAVHLRSTECISSLFTVFDKSKTAQVVNPDTIEGSGGPILFNTYISPDDGDYYVPIPKKNNPNSLNKNIKEVAATPKRLRRIIT
ncbi:hypothetical protein EB796_015465 [Bugula neritina]|uniref:Uncharacterized protein n=1 Tax=Bugula neritina TaxID=10212 RepID=A0A7J7JIX2_BUGNE|nr:hypothetical protein EB796_015465 [Bugula neritina]